MSGDPQIACHHCGTLHVRHRLSPGDAALCSVCDNTLYRSSRLPLHAWLALAFTAFIVFIVANALPIVSLTLQGSTAHASLPGALWLTWNQGYYGTAVITGLFSFWFPLTQILVVLWALMVLRSGRVPSDFHLGLRLLKFSAPWSMLPVFVLGILVALVKMVDLASVKVEPALIAFGLLTVLLTLLSRCSPSRLWHMAEDAGLVPVAGVNPTQAGLVAACESCGFLHELSSPHEEGECRRCGAAVHYRHPAWRVRVWALVLAAAIAYVPANVLPVMVISMAGRPESHTILGGVVELWEWGAWDLAVVVFVASIAVPITKLMALVVLMMGSRWRGAVVQRQRTRLYEMVEIIGQWSMLDVFVVLLMTAMADFPGLSQIVPGPGAFSFGLVVILTMLAAMSYDPRRGWDLRFEAPASLPSSTAASAESSDQSLSTAQ